MTDTIMIETGGAPLSFRLLSLIFGLIFFPLGLYGSAQVVLATIDVLRDRPVEGSFLIGTFVSLISVVVGGGAIWLFFIPDEVLVFDGKMQTLTSTRTYPLGRVRTRVFDFAEVPAPEVVWTKNSDLSDGGSWDVKITLPGGRAIKHMPPARSTMAQKSAAETLRRNILDLIG